MRIDEIAKVVDVTYQQVSGDELYGKLIPSKINKGVQSRIKYLNTGWNDIQHEFDIVATVGGKIVGVAGMQQSPHEERVIWVTYVSVDPEFRSNGIATQLVTRVFEYARKHNQRIRGSSYTEMGEQYLKQVFERTAKQFPDVPFKDGRDHYKFDYQP
jgi:GNAT superfamily N-acetyltransferase